MVQKDKGKKENIGKWEYGVLVMKSRNTAFQFPPARIFTLGQRLRSSLSEIDGAEKENMCMR